MNELDYRIVRSPKRKTLSIVVERDRTVVVRAPETMPEEDVRRAVDAKRQWISEKLRSPQKYMDRVHPPGKEVVSGESAPYLGTDYRIEITETESGQVEFDRGFLVPPAHQAKRREVLRDWYMSKAKETILARAQRHARELGVGFKSARIVDNRYRWGSCTVTDSVNFNWRLIKAPMFVIDYVIIHELAHLLEANHTDTFWSIVRARTPTMEKAKAWLKEHGQMLEEEI
jgi:predicted metal-dependent hydrolase